MIGGVLVTHGRLGDELLEAARHIVGELPHLTVVALGWSNDVAESRKRIAEAAKAVDAGQGVIILTDMFGGSPSNLAMPLLKKDQVEIVTGVNLPMVIKMANQASADSLAELARKVRDQGRKHISIAGELLGE